MNELKNKRCLVTGGAGFIGSHLVDGLLEAGAEVRVLDNFATGHRENLDHCKDRIELIEGDIRELETCQQACEGVSVVFHQAALGSVPRSVQAPATSLAVNVGGTANVFTAARDAGTKRVVYASSSSVYGSNEELPKREGREGAPLSPYAVSKWMTEELADTFARVYGMELVGLRYFNVYGPRQDPNGPYAAVIPKFFAACARGEPPMIYGDGQQSRDFTFVADVVRANMLAATAPIEGAIALNIGAGSTTTVTELAEAIIALVGTDLTPKRADPRPGDVRYSRADFSLAKGALGWEATVALHEGLARTKPS
ncbi:MAG TPA: SDR family oxidoreductase [Polyangiaceae bacterium]|nr:SDR family oxidoreductase [Polyangiaceae bacterium]